MKKRYCIRNHDTSIVGRRKRMCNACEQERLKIKDEKRINDPIRKMIKNTKARIKQFERK